MGNALQSSVGRKVVMAFSGLLLLLFLLVHAVGNATIFTGGLNAYAAGLQVFPPAVWFFRAVLLALFLVHAWFGVALTFENRTAKPEGYAVTVYRTSSVSSRTMIWTGLALGFFLLFHLAHFSLQVIHPEASARAHPDPEGHADILRMVVLGFDDAALVASYLLAMFALAMHLFHGIQSSAQTLGLNGPRSFAGIQQGGRLLALLLALLFMAIPAAVLAGFIR